MSKRIKLFVVDNQMNFIDSVNDYLLKYPNFHIDMIGKSVSKNEFMNNRDIFMDVDVFVISSSLPDGTGIELYEYVKGIRALSDIPVIFTVDKQTRNQISIAESLGVKHILQKPFNAGDLYKKILFLGLRKKEILNDVSYDTFERDPLSYIPENEQSLLNDSQSNNETEDNNSSLGSYESNEIFKNSEDGMPNDNPTLNEVYYEKETIEDIEESYFKNIDKLDIEEFEVELEQKQKTKNIDGGVISFFSPKSTGKSSIISNIARGLIGGKTKPSVCILDLNYHFPTITQLFDQEELVKPQKNIYDVYNDTSYMNEELIESALIKHKPTGINILNTPNDLESVSRISLITTDQVEKVLLQVREMFDFVLVDTHNEITSTTNLTLLEYSDKNYIVLEPDFTTVTGGNKILQAIKVLEEEKIQDISKNTFLVMNKDTKKLQDSLNDNTIINFMYGKKFVTRIPYDEDFNTYINKAEFAILSGSPTAKPLMILTNHIFPKSGIKLEKKKFLKLPDNLPFRRKK